MNYQETTEFLFNSLPIYQRIGKAAYKANLDNTIALDLALGQPHLNFKSIHVAGTNGKGSVSHMLASILQAAGYKTGLYTSPHLLDFRERIRINGEMISEESVISFVQKIEEEIEIIKPSFFEMTVAMAFDHFSRDKVDIAIIETGLGGRLDSTNIIDPELSIITSISLDHTEFLGSTSELIAIEKAGIIKKGKPVVFGKNTPEIIDILSQIASEKNAPSTLSEKERVFSYQTLTPDYLSVFHYHNRKSDSDEHILSDLIGAYQHENIATALSAVEQLKKAGWSISDKDIKYGISHVKSSTFLRGRWEILGANPRIICDTAHNASGISLVINQLRQTPQRTLHIVWGMLGDKPSQEILSILPKDAIYYFTRPSIPRAMETKQLMEQAANAKLTGSSYPDVSEAFLAAQSAASSDDTIFIGGSTFMVADLLQNVSFNK